MQLLNIWLEVLYLLTILNHITLVFAIPKRRNTYNKTRYPPWIEEDIFKCD